MNCPECAHRLHDYVDGELTPTEASVFETHVTACASCRDQLEALRTLLAHTRRLPLTIAPSRDLWTELAPRLMNAEASSEPEDARESASVAVRSSLRWFLPLATAAALVFLAMIAERWTVRNPAATWSIAALAGTPQLDARTVQPAAQLRVGQWLETDGTSRARIAAGPIGEVTVDPNSRLRLAGSNGTDHRLDLARGTLHAVIWAPPRLFFVNTPSATAIDLGCAYTLTVDDQGDGELHVTTGFVALEHRGRESIVPAHSMCLTRHGSGPGTPFADSASDGLRHALQQFDFEPHRAAAALPTILAEARDSDAVTLWHLLARTASAPRGDVFDLLARLRPPPAGVTRAGILAGDQAMRRAWAIELGFGALLRR